MPRGLIEGIYLYERLTKGLSLYQHQSTQIIYGAITCEINQIQIPRGEDLRGVNFSGILIFRNDEINLHAK